MVQPVRGDPIYRGTVGAAQRDAATRGTLTATRTHLWRVMAPEDDDEAGILIVHRGVVTFAPEELDWTKGHRFSQIHRYLRAHRCRLERLSA